MNLTYTSRRVFFYALTLFFTLLSPYLISHAFGYAFDFATWEVEQTGGIFIKSENPRVSIALDGIHIKETSIFSGNALITELKPGAHDLLITKEGYNSWRKTIAIHSLLVTELRDVVLIPAMNTSATSTAEEKDLIRSRKSFGAYAQDENAPSFSLDKKNNLLRAVGTTTRVVASDVHSFAPAGNQILFVNKNGFLSSFNPEDDSLRVLGRPGFYLTKQPVTFIPSPNGEVALIDSAGGLFLIDRESNLQTIGGGVKKILFNSSGTKALIVKEKSLELLWREKNSYQPFQETGAREEITALTENIQDAAWFHFDAAHAVIKTDSRILFIDLDGRGGHYIQELFSGSADDIVTTPDAPKKIFYRTGEEYYTMEL